MKKRLIIGLMCFLLIFQAAGCHKAALGKVQQEQLDKIASPAPKDMEGLQIDSIIDSGKGYVIAAHYPVIKKGDIAKTIRKKMKSRVDLFKQNLAPLRKEGKLPGKDQTAYELNIDFECYRYNDNIVSFVFKENAYLGGPQPDQTMFSYTFNTETGEEIALEELFDPNSNYLNILSTLTRTKLTSDSALMKLSTKDLVYAGTEAKADKFATFALDGRGLIFFFPPYQVAQYEAGYRTTVLRYDEIKDICQVEEVCGEADLSDSKLPEPTPTPTPTPKATAVAKDPSLEGKKLIAITFDDGPNPKTTPKLLDMLKQKGVKATFFMLGSRASAYPNIVKRIYEEGHTLGSHTYSHKDLKKLSDADVTAESQKTIDAIQAACGQSPIVARPPYGSSDERVRGILNMPIVLWNIDPNDWKDRDANIVAQRIISKAKPNSIILLHDIYPTSVEAAGKVIDELRRQGYTFVTVDQLIIQKYGSMQAGKIY